MPKGNAAARRLRQKLKDIEAQLQLDRGIREQSRAVLRRPVTFDWRCVCGYYCYFERDRCPQCQKSKGTGMPINGYQRRVMVGTQVVVPQPLHASSQREQQNFRQLQQRPPQPKAPVQVHQLQKPGALQPGPQVQQHVQARSYAEAARAAAQQPRLLQLTPQQQQQTTQPPQKLIQAPRPQPQQPQQQQAYPQAAAASIAHEVPLRPTARPVGLQSSAAAAAGPPPTAGEPVLCRDIFTADEDAALDQEDAWVDEDTIQELDDEVDDPNRVWGRIGKVRKAIQRREKRLQKAHDAVEEQKAVVEEAQSELANRAAAADSCEADLQRLKEVLQDLARRHAELVAAVAQPRPPPQLSAEAVAQRAQQWLYSTAAGLREFGDDPRISQACALLGELFNDASAAAAPRSGLVGSPDVHTAAPCGGQQFPHSAPPTPEVQLPPHPAPTHPATTLTLSSVVSPPPPAAQPAPIICNTCWSISCRCIRSSPGDDVAGDMAVDLERGKKRSCIEAELPQRSSGGMVTPGSFPVDSSGNATVPSSAAQLEGSAAAPQQPVQVRAAECQTSEEAQPEAIVVELEGVSSRSAAAVEPVPREPRTEDDGSGVPGAYAKSDKTAEETDKEESRIAFASIVKATCSKRTHPY